MKSLVNGCAAAALLMGLAVHAHAEIAVREAPVHTIPAADDDASAADPADASPAQTEDADADAKVEAQSKVEHKSDVRAEAPAPVQAKAEPAAVKALVEAKAPPSLTPEENAFFARLGQRVTDAASAYESYVRRAGAIDPAFSGGGQVQRAVQAGAAYHPVQLQEGVIAYAALIALRDQAFVDGVRAIQNPAFADDLAAHPQNVMQVRGAPEAAADVAGVLRAQGDLLIAQGKAITKAAYDIQAQAWSKSPVSDPKAVLDGAKASAGQTRVATTPSKERLLESLVSAPQPTASSAGGAGPAPDVARGLALAAMAILGKTGDGEEARYEALLRDSSSEECLKLAKLNLNQCLAVAGPHYEDVYCAGRHAVSDTGQCIASAAGGASDVAVRPPQLQEVEAPAPVAAQTQAVAQTQPRAPTMGPEQADAYGKTASATDDDDDATTPAPARRLAAAPPAPAPIVVPAPPSAMAALAQGPAPAPAPRPYADAPRQYAEAPQAELQYPQAEPRAEPMPDPRLPRQAPPAPSYAPRAQPQPYNYAQNDYAPAQPPPPQYGRGYAQPAYPQSSYQQPYQPYRQAYPQAQYAPQPYQQPYAPQPYPQSQGYAPSYSGQQPYYPQAQGYPSYQGGYYGR